MRKVDDDYLNWYFGYLNSKLLGLQYFINSRQDWFFGGGKADSKFLNDIAEEFSARVVSNSGYRAEIARILETKTRIFLDGVHSCADSQNFKLIGETMQYDFYVNTISWPLIIDDSINAPLAILAITQPVKHGKRRTQVAYRSGFELSRNFQSDIFYRGLNFVVESVDRSNALRMAQGKPARIMRAGMIAARPASFAHPAVKIAQVGIDIVFEAALDLIEHKRASDQLRPRLRAQIDQSFRKMQTDMLKPAGNFDLQLQYVQRSFFEKNFQPKWSLQTLPRTNSNF